MNDIMSVGFYVAATANITFIYPGFHPKSYLYSLVVGLF